MEVFDGLQRRRSVRYRLILRDARALKDLFESGGHEQLGYSCLGDLAEDLGYAADEGRRLYAVARVLQWMPDLEAQLFSGRMNIEKAAALARLFDTPGAIHDGDTWLHWAERSTTAEFQRRVNRRVEETLRGEPLEKVSFWVTENGADQFRRCRSILSRRAERRITRGETLESLTTYFLRREDPLSVKPAKRRVPDTGGGEGVPSGTTGVASTTDRRSSATERGSPATETPSRYIPAEVKRAVRTRAGDRCEFAACSFDTWLDFAHIVPHRSGGSREAANLLLLCGIHHRSFDAGMWRIRMLDGRAVFVDRWARHFPGPRLGKQDPPGSLSADASSPAELPAGAPSAGGCPADEHSPEELGRPPPETG